MGCEAPGDEPVEHDLHGILAGEYDPAIRRKAGERGAKCAQILEWLNADDGRQHGNGAAFLERPDQIARLFARTCHHDAAPR